MARRAATLIRSEIASNRRMLEAASSDHPPRTFTEQHVWINNRADLAGAEYGGCCLCQAQEAYDAFEAVDSLLRHPSARNPTNDELFTATNTATAAETALTEFLRYIEERGRARTHSSFKRNA